MTFEDKLKKKIEREKYLFKEFDGNEKDKFITKYPEIWDDCYDIMEGSRYHRVMISSFDEGANLLATLLVECQQFLKYTAQTDISETPPDFLWLQRWRDDKKQYAQNILNKLNSFVKEGQND